MPKKKPKEEPEEDFELDFEGLEEEIEHEAQLEKEKLNINSLNLSNFVPQQVSPSADVEAPVLERMALRETGPVFVGTMPQGVSSQEKKENGEGEGVKYLPAQDQDSQEPKYIESDSRITTQPTRINTVSLGRENPLRQNSQNFQRANQQEFFERFSEGRSFGSPSVEKTWQTERFDVSQAGRENPLEVEKKEYEQYRPDLPSSK
jgi:hypothetical protein